MFVEVMEERNSHVVLRSDFSRNQFASYRQGLISHLWMLWDAVQDIFPFYQSRTQSLLSHCTKRLSHTFYIPFALVL